MLHLYSEREENVLCVAMLGAPLCGAILALAIAASGCCDSGFRAQWERSQCERNQYTDVDMWLTLYPEISFDVAQAMADDVLTQGEYKHIEKATDEARKRTDESATKDTARFLKIRAAESVDKLVRSTIGRKE